MGGKYLASPLLLPTPMLQASSVLLLQNPRFKATTRAEMSLILQGKNKPWSVISLQCPYFAILSVSRIHSSSNAGKIHDWWSGNDLAGSGRGPVEILAQHLLEGLRETTKILTQNGRCFGKASNPLPPENESTGLPISHSALSLG
jgi:hypothetical protein